jgi:hypothetical protein
VQFGLSEAEIAFYDALETSDSAIAVLDDETLKAIARDLVETVRNNTSIDWALREAAQAKLRVMVKRLLRKYYPQIGSTTPPRPRGVLIDRARTLVGHPTDHYDVL